jgi:hypothetical protein
MNLSSIRKHYRVTHHEDNKYFVYDKNVHSGSRMVYKYLCLIEKVSETTFKVSGRSLETTKLKLLIEEIKTHVASLKYDSEYYYPMYREGLFEEFIVCDYLSDIGFKSDPGYFNNTTIFTLKHNNIYGSKTDDIILSISFKIEETIKLYLHCDQLSWVEVSCKREVESIKDAINSLIKPLLVTESVHHLKTSQKVGDIKQFGDLTINQITSSYDKISKEFKTELKEQLTKMLEIL